MHTAAAVYGPRLAVGLERPLDVPRRNTGRNQPIVAAPVVADTFKPDLKAALEFNPVVADAAEGYRSASDNFI